MLTLFIIIVCVLVAASQMASYGVRTLETGGRGIQVSADGVPRWKAGGVTIDWSTVTAVTEDTTLDDGTIVKNGDKYLRYGTILTQITVGGKFGECLTNLSDGRETVTNAVRGRAFILNETVVYSEPHSDHPAVFDGGLVFKGRLKYGGANQPTEANIETMFPAITFVADAG
jgi:hypothetical protein